MQNQTPEIQAKLLAMQKHMVQQKQDDVKTIVAPSSHITSLPRQEVNRTIVESQEAKNARAKQAAALLTPEQKETHARLLFIHII